MDSNARFRYSYTGSGWSVRSIDPEKAEPKRDARRTPRLAVVFGAFAVVCVVAGSVIFARRAPQLEQPPSVATASRPDFIVSSPVIPANKVGSIPGLAAPAPATPETREPVEASRPQPKPTGEGVRPSSEGTSTAVDASRAQPGKAIPRAAQRPRELRGKVARIVLSSGPRGDLQSDAVDSPIVIAPGQEKSVVLYTELRDLAGQTVFHRWERGGRAMAVIPFRIGSDRWRVHSSKRMTSALKGQWQVVVTDARGAALASRSFVVR